jgi:ribosomal protein L40E
MVRLRTVTRNWQLCGISILLFVLGCDSGGSGSFLGFTTIHQRISSDPPGADIYRGSSRYSLKHYGNKTPYHDSFTDLGPYWTAGYYQVRKDGYYDSEVVFREKGREHNVHFVLKPVGASSANPETTWTDAMHDRTKPVDSLVCSKCSTRNAPGSKFCENCGTKLDRTKPVDSLVCSKCSTRNAPGSKFCENCGTKLDGL